MDASIIYTYTDEAPFLATYSLLPIVTAFARAAGVSIGTRDISLAGRVLALFPEHLRPEQRVGDDLSELAALTLEPAANIIKLPNISASIPQLKEAIAELQADGYAVPDYPDTPRTDDERAIRARYGKVLGSAVNPVLREGNSDRRCPPAVKHYAQTHPHAMGRWAADCKTNVAHMTAGDFRSSEQSAVIQSDGALRIELVRDDGSTTALRESVPVVAGEIVDASRMSATALDAFLEAQIARAKADGVLFSLHVKATMMRISDPIIFGHTVRAFFPRLFAGHGEALATVGGDPDEGLGAILQAAQKLAPDQRAAVEAAIRDGLAGGPALAMVDSGKGITNLHVPSDVIIDASMPAMIRRSGHMFGPDGTEGDTLAVIPDSSYAGIYQLAIDDVRANGQYDPVTLGSVANVGLMAQAAEEYGSHDKTFKLPATGTVRVVDQNGKTILEQRVEAGDIWRMCQTKDVAIRDWVKLAVARARISGQPAIFWLDDTRAHDANVIAKVRTYLAEHDTAGLDIHIMPLEEAMRFTLARFRNGQDTISVTGNVLRDYLTDLFPILEVGTSAKMLSVVPLIAGGGLFETGAGGTAPMHVEQVLKEDFLRWDSLGEYLALAASFEQLAQTAGNQRAQILADTLDRATGTFLDKEKSPGRKLGETDNRGSSFSLALYWAEELASQTNDSALAAVFRPVAAALRDNEQKISQELLAVQGGPVDVGGYYRPDPARTATVMRPSSTFNAILERLAPISVG